MEYSDRISKLANGSLRIGSVTMADTGSWTIVADNRLGQVARKQIALKVHPNRMPIEVSPGNSEGRQAYNRINGPLTYPYFNSVWNPFEVNLTVKAYY